MGTVVKANGEEGPLGFVSALSVATHAAHPALKHVLAFLRRHCPPASAAQLEQARGGAAATLLTAQAPRCSFFLISVFQTLASPRLGLLLSERMINLPGEVAPPLVSGLFEELRDVGGDWWWASEAAPSDALRDSFAFDHLLLLTRVYRDDAPADDNGGGGAGGGGGKGARAPPPPKAARTRPGAPPPPKLVYPKPEDEAFHSHSSWSFLFQAAVTEPSAVADRASQLTQMRLVMCVPVSRAAAVQADTERIVASGGGA